MKKLYSAIICLMLATVVWAHNPLQGTTWMINDDEGKPTFIIDFSSAASGTITIDGQECMFMYGANHTDLFIKMNDCKEIKEKSIIPCCDQQAIPFRSDENGNLVLIINEKEHVLVAKR